MYSSKDKIGLVRLLFGTFLLFQILSASALDQSIAYLRLTEGYWQVWVTDSKGKEHRQLTFDASDKARISWSKTPLKIK